jgi:hypothetical protein
MYRCKLSCKMGAMFPPSAKLLIPQGERHSVNSDGSAET